jgi:ethylmalonyl-CoA/methylmalonyl-CoA decarboxylase
MRDVARYGERISRLMHDNLMRFELLPLITCALVEGKAVGGGAELCTPCDFRLMTSDAEIGFVHIRMGLTTGWGGGCRLARLLGPGKSLRLMASELMLSATECLSIGLVDHVFDPNEPAVLLKSACGWLTRFTKNENLPLCSCKQIVTAAKYMPPEAALTHEREIFAATWGNPAHEAALEAKNKHK